MATRMPRARWELHAQSGRAVLIADDASGEYDPESLNLPTRLAVDLHEWAQVAATVSRSRDTGDPVDAEVSRRGYQLAMRLAVETGGEVGYVDPVTGETSWLGWPRPASQFQRRGFARAAVAGQRRPARGWLSELSVAKPTPWVTGLTVSAIVAALVAIALVIVTLELAEMSGGLAVVVNLGMVAGFAPSIWLGRRILVWRWVAFGATGGIALAWSASLLSLLG